MSEAGPAIFSADRVYRYVLEREWDADLPKPLFIGLNPSTADELKLDPTMRRLRASSKRWGFGGFIMCNLFAFRSTDPLALRLTRDPVGPDNDRWIRESAARARLIVPCWGTHGSYMHRDMGVRRLLSRYELRCFGTTKHGHPKHPLYLPDDTKLEVFA
jgi:hypothetical protein